MSFRENITIPATRVSSPIDVTLFFKKGSGPFDLIVKENAGIQYGSLVHLIDPDGENVHWSVKPRDSERFDLIGNPAVYDSSSDETTHTINVPSDAGVYKLIVKGYDGDVFGIETTADIDEWGIYIPSDDFTESVFSDKLDNYYVFVPGEAPEYGFITEGTIGIQDSTGSINITETGTSNNRISGITNATLGSDDIWVVTTGSDFKIEHNRIAMVFCNSITAANSIQSGTVESSGIRFWSKGEAVAHERAKAVVNTLNSTDFTTVVQTFDDAVTDWEANPRKYNRARGYPNCLKAIHMALARQNLDTESYRCGLMNPYSGATTGMLAMGDNDLSTAGGFFAFLGGWNDSTNPYYGDAEILKRARIGMLGDLKRIQGFRVADSVVDRASRLGTVGLGLIGGTGDTLHWNEAANNIYSEDFDAIQINLNDILDRIFAHFYTSTLNQDCSVLPLLVMAPKIWKLKYGNDNLKALCIREAKNITTGSYSSGALEEANGFDGSYSGIQNYELSAAYLASGKAPEWKFLLDTIDRNYTFFSNFVASSSSGLGVYGHDNDSRTNLGSLDEQFGGAQHNLCHLSKYAATWARLSGRNRDADDSFGTYITQMNTEITNNTQNQSLFRTFGAFGFQAHSLWEYSYDNITSAVMLPCELSVNETIVTENDYLISIQTPSYYVSIPTITPHRYYYERTVAHYNTPRDVDINGGRWLQGSTYSNGANPINGEEIGGNGISLLYSKEANRPVINGKTVCPWTTHQIVGETSGNNIRSADPNTRTYDVNTDTNVVKISYDIFDSTLTVTKTLTFSDSRIDIENEVYRGTGTNNVTEIYESIPLCASTEVLGADIVSIITSAIQNPDPEYANLGNTIGISAGFATGGAPILMDETHDDVTYARIDMDMPSIGATTSMHYSIHLPSEEIEDDPETIEERRPNGAWGVTASRLNYPKFVPDHLHNTLFLTKRGWEQKLGGSNNDKGMMEVIVAGNFGRASGINESPRIINSSNPLTRTLNGDVGVPIQPYIIEIQDPNKVLGGDSVSITSYIGLPDGLTISKSELNTPIEIFKISGTPTTSERGTINITFSDESNNSVFATIGFVISGDITDQPEIDGFTELEIDEVDETHKYGGSTQIPFPS